MAAVTQLIPSYLGGVSTQPDVKKLNGQVKEALNCFADPTFGMTKRSGSVYLSILDDSPKLKDGKWFFILRDNREAYIGVIKDDDIRIWNAITSVEANVDVTAGKGYLKGQTTARPERLIYDVLTIQDKSIITNKTVKVEAKPTPSVTYGLNATVRLLEVSYGSDYVVTIDGTEKVRYEAPDTPDSEVINAKTILDALYEGLKDDYTVTQLDSSLEIQSATPFTIDTEGGVTNDGLISFQDRVDVASKLPNQSIEGRTIEVLELATDGLGYWSTFSADDGTSGNGIWEETLAPDVSPGFKNSTMPHELLSLGPDISGVSQFTFRPISYEDRLVGNDATNPQPSFIGFPIQKSFFNNNRLGFLSEANVIMSKSSDFFNFYSGSAQQQVASDVIDLSASSTRPVLLFSCLSVAQGLLLFSRRQQFLLYSDDGPLSPATSIIRQISEYEMNVDVEPVNTGTQVIFTSKSPSQSRVYSMVTRGSEDDPLVADIGKVVSGYLPDSIDYIDVSTQNEMTIFSGVNDQEMYFYKTYSNGQEVIIQSWFKWSMPGNMQTFFAVEDRLFSVCDAGGHYILSVVYFNQVQETEVIISDNGQIIGNPSLDFYTRPTKLELSGKDTKAYLPFKIDKPATFLVTSPRTGSFRRTNIDEFGYAGPYGSSDTSGYYVPVTKFDSDAGGNFALIEGQDLTSYATHCIVGYDYEMSLNLPQIYYKLDGNDKVSDYTASTTISRLKFSVGLTSAIEFKVQARGSKEWESVQPVVEADYYLANDIPLVDSNIFILPIYQRTTNFLVKATSDFPFPVSINSMMWEGQYSPRYYRRT